jgi:outer membrane protein insertion porin family
MTVSGRVCLALCTLLVLVVVTARSGVAQTPAPRQIQIREITVEGNRRVQEAVILGRVQSKVGSPFNPSLLSEDLRAIFGLGFFDDVQMRVEDFEGGVRVTFVVVERPFIRDVTFAGNKHVSTSTLNEKLELKLGTVYNPVEVQKAREKLKEFLEDEGYFEAQITPETEKFPDGDVRIVFNIAEGRRITIDSTNFKGNKYLTDKLLKAVMATQERQFFILRGTVQRQKLETDVERLLALYNDYGFIQARVESTDVAVDRENARVTITIGVVEGPQFRVGEIRFTGITLLPEKEVRRQLKFHSGDPFSRSQLRDSVRAIADLYSTIGRASADVNPRTDQTTTGTVMDVTFDITEGPEVYIERINISGNLRSQDKVLRRELPMQEGELFTLQKLQRARQRLVNLGYFDNVVATTQPGADKTKTIVNIEVTEKPTGLFSIGGGFSSVDSFIGTVDLSQRNFLGRGYELSLRLRGGSTTQQGTISFTDPYLFDMPLSGGFDLFKTRRVFTDYTLDSTGAGVRVSKPFLEYWRWFAGYSLRDDRISHVNGVPSTFVLEQEGDFITSVVSSSVSRDSRDNVFAPTRGWTFSVGTDVAGFGGDSRYVKTIANSTYFQPVWFDHIISARVEGGYGFGLGNKDLPLFERFYLGGPNSLRMFKFRQVSPKDENGLRVGGTSEVLGNTEYIIPLPFNIRLAAFFDVGNVYGFHDEFDITNLKYGVGAGVRWLSPFGPIRVDYGFKLNRRSGEDPGAFNFSVGSPF